MCGSGGGGSSGGSSGGKSDWGGVKSDNEFGPGTTFSNVGGTVGGRGSKSNLEMVGAAGTKSAPPRKVPTSLAQQSARFLGTKGDWSAWGKSKAERMLAKAGMLPSEWGTWETVGRVSGNVLGTIAPYAGGPMLPGQSSLAGTLLGEAGKRLDQRLEAGEQEQSLQGSVKMARAATKPSKPAYGTGGAETDLGADEKTTTGATPAKAETTVAAKTTTGRAKAPIDPWGDSRDYRSRTRTPRSTMLTGGYGLGATTTGRTLLG